MSNAAPWIVHVSFAPGNEMHVTVKHCLASDLACINTDVESLNGRVFTFDVITELSEQNIAGKKLILCQ
jgi:hypothetical protein